jgi:hypothetical protein
MTFGPNTAAAATAPDWGWLRRRPLFPAVQILVSARRRPPFALTQLEMAQWLLVQAARGPGVGFEPSPPPALLRGEQLNRSSIDRLGSTDLVLAWWANRSLPQAFAQARKKLALATHADRRDNEHAAHVLELIGWSSCFNRTHRLQATELSRQVAARAGAGADDLLLQARACRRLLQAPGEPELPRGSA